MTGLPTDIADEKKTNGPIPAEHAALLCGSDVPLTEEFGGQLRIPAINTEGGGSEAAKDRTGIGTEKTGRYIDAFTPLSA